jgi:L-fuculose-phosphate aldolase
MSQNMANIHQVKLEMCDIGKRIWMKGYCAGNEGNHSVRISDDRVLCTPTGLSKGFLTPDMITMVDMDGNQVDKANKFKRTSEVLLHLAIYRKRPDVRAVVHSHPPHATAFAVANIPIPEGIHPEAEVFLGKVLTAPYVTPSYAELGQEVCKLIDSESNTIMLANHGSVTFAPQLIDAYYKLEILDAYCRILLLCAQLGKVRPLSQDQMIKLLEVKQKFGIKDSRLACAPSGCIGQENDEFLAMFEDGQLMSKSQTQTTTAPTADSIDEATFEQLVQSITNQIMAVAK